jgi:hypothetical protein
MSDFGNLAAYIYELEAEIPPATLMKFTSRPAFLTPLPDPAAAKAPAPKADEKK